ncbi:voltage-gated potassium channel [Virgibacillus natechei]|uniref:Voltage-gated potassium channel n=1 Tax=Virgibacillus natechei TaxID=1216297 RepID=A0ABS4IG21_9BACI|nr:potassium channel family protein [Virgibacillus natechei]MBP1969545.1 voltage-gated potassium channel [Virgibacillus natechei]UZD11754.1 potassium channel family protein [Virgibacillus natechei]
MSIKRFKYVFYRLPIILRLLITIFIVMFVYGCVIHLVEPEQFPSIFEGVWWAIVTASTVGYGDYVPLSNSGRIVSILLILTGGGLIAFYITTFAATTVQREQDLESGRISFKGKDHLVFIGWNERTRQLLDITLDNNPDIRIVLIDRTLNHIAFQHYPVHFIHGDATEDNTLKQANIPQAKRVIITADITKNERQSDNYTILTTVAVRGNNNDVPIIAEILSEIQIDNALRAGASTIIKSNDFMSALLYHELSSHDKAKPFDVILHLLKTQQFSQQEITEDLEEKTFLEASSYYLKDSEEQHILLGFIRDNEWHVNPSADFILEKEDILISICNW